MKLASLTLASALAITAMTAHAGTVDCYGHDLDGVSPVTIHLYIKPGVVGTRVNDNPNIVWNRVKAANDTSVQFASMTLLTAGDGVLIDSDLGALACHRRPISNLN